MNRELYGEKCLRCTHVRHDKNPAELRWFVADDDCQDCHQCQDDAFHGAFLRCFGEDIWTPKVREAIQAFRSNRPHPLIDELRREMQENPD